MSEAKPLRVFSVPSMDRDRVLGMVEQLDSLWDYFVCNHADWVGVYEDDGEDREPEATAPFSLTADVLEDKDNG